MNLTNETLISNISKISSSTQCFITLNRNFEYYAKNALNISGIVTNFICIIVFYKIIKNEIKVSNMYNYLLVKSMNDFLLFAINSFQWAYYCTNNCGLRNFYWLQIWYVYFYYFGDDLLLLSSGFLEVIATFDCFLLITKRLKVFMCRNAFILVIVIVYSISSLLSVYNIVRFKIISKQVKISANETKIIYDKMNTNFYVSSLYEYCKLMVTIVRDYLTLLFILVINSLILLNMKKMSARKKAMMRCNSNNRLVQRSVKAGRNKFKMITFTGVKYLTFHLPMSIRSLLRFLNYHYLDCIGGNLFDLMIFSYTISLFIYILFNKLFRRHLFSIILKLKCKFK
jgi:hypothetical protein